MLIKIKLNKITMKIGVTVLTLLLSIALTLPAPFYGQSVPNYSIESYLFVSLESSLLKYQSDKKESDSYNKENGPSFWNWVNRNAYADALDKKSEEIRLRQEWEKLLKVDIFYPYYKAKEAQEWVKEKGSVKIFNMKGKPEFDKNTVEYIFKVKF